jgi:predicted nucleotidyltransferase
MFCHMSTIALTRDEAIRRLQIVESEIRRLGVRRLPLFGSVLRNEARPDSDVDVLVEFTLRQKSRSIALWRWRICSKTLCSTRLKS